MQVGPRNYKKKQQIIDSFPIPNSKEDILEFLILLKPKACDDKDPLVKAYLHKYEECLERAKTFFGDDPDFMPFREAYPEMAAHQKKQKKGNRWILLMIMSGRLCILSLV